MAHRSATSVLLLGSVFGVLLQLVVVFSASDPWFATIRSICSFDISLFLLERSCELFLIFRRVSRGVGSEESVAVPWR